MGINVELDYKDQYLKQVEFNKKMFEKHKEELVKIKKLHEQEKKQLEIRFNEHLKKVNETHQREMQVLMSEPKSIRELRSKYQTKMNQLNQEMAKERQELFLKELDNKI